MAGGFKRSGLFGLIGVVVVAIVVAVIATTMGGNDPNPKPALALIFGVIAAFVVVLLVLQRSDLERVAATSTKETDRAIAEGGHEIDNPTTMAEADLWASLAVKPIDAEAIQARGQMWDSSRRSLKLAAIVVTLIFLTVPSIYLFESFLPLLIGGPLIAIAAVYGSVRAIGPGGELDQGYERVGLAMAPLGLEVTERPKVDIETRDAVTGRVGPQIRGELALSGERRGRRVSVRLGSGEVSTKSEVTVCEPCRAFTAKSRKVTIESGPEGIVVTRKGGEQADWLCDLWLAERLADTA